MIPSSSDWRKELVLTWMQQEFSIEIPDKEADAIHSGKFRYGLDWISDLGCANGLIPKHS